MKEIPLSKGQVTIVDDVDYEWLNQWKWYAWWDKNAKSYYAVRSIWVDGKGSVVRMHRIILGLESGDKRQGDHGLGNTLDNRRKVNGKDNLRIATSQQNSCNQKLRDDNTSGLKCVSFHRVAKKWKAQIAVRGKDKYLGLFETAEQAHAAYCGAAEMYHGEFART